MKAKRMHLEVRSLKRLKKGNSQKGIKFANLSSFFSSFHGVVGREKNHMG